VLQGRKSEGRLQGPDKGLSLSFFFAAKTAEKKISS
jgi:hypothetical protein